MLLVNLLYINNYNFFSPKYIILIYFGYHKYIVFIITNILSVLEKGVKVVRSPSEILALIKSCDNISTKEVPEAIHPIAVDHPINKTSAFQVPQNILKKTFRPLGPNRLFKPNVDIHEVSESVDQQENKNIDTQTLNITGNKKLI